MTSRIRFTLIDRHTDLLDAWRAAFNKHLPSSWVERFTLLQSDIRTAGTYDCVVSPANSYGIMDGGIDLYIAISISHSNPSSVIKSVQSHLYTSHRGYIPPGQCTLVPLPSELRGEENKLGCKYVAVLPTMRLPERVEWNREVVYECVWSLLLALEKHNASVQSATVSSAMEVDGQGGGQGEEEIKTVIMSGLGTGTGGISAQRCAEQMALAFKHFEEAGDKPEKWSGLSWEDVEALDEEIGPTRKL